MNTSPYTKFIEVMTRTKNYPHFYFNDGHYENEDKKFKYQDIVVYQNNNPTKYDKSNQVKIVEAMFV